MMNAKTVKTVTPPPRMGRLFWKFFFFVLLAQVTTIAGLGVSFAIRDMARAQDAAEAPRVAIGPPAGWHVAAAAAILQHGGVQALRDFLAGEAGPRVYALDATEGQDILQREVSPDLRARALALASAPRLPPGMRAAQSPDGRRYLLFMAMPPSFDGMPSERIGPFVEHGPLPGPHHAPPHARVLPLAPMVFALIGSLIFAGLLAWYFSKPIRHLHAAFDAAAGGDLETRLEPVLGRRRDELSDLGRDFDRMAARLRELMDGQRRLLHQVSHEVRSPLARLQAAIGLARQSPEKAEAMIERIEREAVRIDQLVGELLTLSRLEAGLADARGEEVDLGNLLADIVDDARFEAAVETIDIIFAGKDKVRTTGNPELLHRAFENVVRNALRYSPRHGAIHVEVAVEPVKGIAHVSICDQGPGVPEGDLEAIFRPFFRGENGKDAVGYGLGLAIAQQIVVAHAGCIRARNRQGGGLCVDVELPATH